MYGVLFAPSDKFVSILFLIKATNHSGFPGHSWFQHYSPMCQDTLQSQLAILFTLNTFYSVPKLPDCNSTKRRLTYEELI